MPSLAIGRHYTDMLVWDIISVTLISVTFYHCGDDFLIVFRFWSLIVKFAQHHLLSKIFISVTNSITEMTSPMLQHMKFECWVKSLEDHTKCSFKWLCTIMNTFHNKNSKFDKLFFSQFLNAKSTLANNHPSRLPFKSLCSRWLHRLCPYT